MIAPWAVILTALVYLCALFAIAHYGDTTGRKRIAGAVRPTIYALALAVYCTSWTFFGSVGLATRSGLDFLAVYVGPILVIGFAVPLVRRVVRLSKTQNITSVADFIASRFGKSNLVAALVCLVAVVGTVPYIALQLKAISVSLSVVLGSSTGASAALQSPVFTDLALLVALVLAGFAMAFGTRKIDATEHHDGLILAIAVESVVKLLAFVAVGLTITYVVYDGFSDIAQKSVGRLMGGAADGFSALIDRTSSLPNVLTIVLLSACATLLLPRQFHTTIVENRDERDIDRAAWMFPLYLVAINIFVIPLAVAGLMTIPDGTIDRDMTVLALPLANGFGLVALLAFVGGLSAATAMVIVDCVALSIMVSNDIVMPALLKRSRNAMNINAAATGRDASGDLGSLVLVARRLAILAIIALGYLYYRAAGSATLASIGLISFAAIAQLAPSFFGGLVWRRGTALGATAGLLGGIAVWAYTLLLPSLSGLPFELNETLTAGPFGIAGLRAHALFGTQMAPLTHGVVWSLIVNLVAFVAFSLVRPANALEQVQANIFLGTGTSRPVFHTLRLWRSSVTIAELKAAIARYLGDERTQQSFGSFAVQRRLTLDDRAEADIHTLRFGEHLLASAIGAASSRLVLSLLLKRRNVSTQAALKLLDDASAALQYSRDILQNALDHARQGITVFDRDLRLMCWNREFVVLFDLPSDLVRVGASLEDIIRFNAQRGFYGPGPTEELVAARMQNFLRETEPMRVQLVSADRFVETRSSHIPDGGIVTTYTDITLAVIAERQLEAVNETLELRVRERTEELERVNAVLQRTKAEAEEANRSKTRFLAAASHDILQPLNAARLYASSLVDRDRATGEPALAENVDGSLEAVEDILTALLDISRLDAGAMKPERSNFRLDELMRQLQREFEPMAREKALRLRFVPTSIAVRSDRRLLRRLLQNLVSNAIKYTENGGIVVGCRRKGSRVSIEVWDTGLGIEASKHKLVFKEFQRLDQGARTARGLGLGLSIVERIARVLDHPVTLRSKPGSGSVFAFSAPMAARLPAQISVPDFGRPADAPLGGLVVVAIDNEPAILDGMRTLLGGWGCTVLTASSARDALQLVKKGGSVPHVLIADYHLDDSNGIDIVMQLRWRFGLDMPALLLTADRSPAVRDEADAKSITVLHKPVRPAALRALLTQWRMQRQAAE